MPEILVTGATGFVGKAVVQRLLAQDELRRVAVAVRRDGQQWPERVLPHVTGDLEPATDWSEALDGVSAVIHCAARVHVMADTAANPLAEFRWVNVQGTLNLARQTARSGRAPFCVCQFHQGQWRGNTAWTAVHCRRCACAAGCLWRVQNRGRAGFTRNCPADWH